MGLSRRDQANVFVSHSEDNHQDSRYKVHPDRDEAVLNCDVEISNRDGAIIFEDTYSRREVDSVLSLIRGRLLRVPLILP